MTQRALVVLGLLLVSLAGLTLTGRSVFGSLSVLFAGVLIVAWAWSWAALRGLSLERTSRSLTSQVGRVFEETLSLKNDSRLPKLWVEVRDESDLPGSWAAARAIGLSSEAGTHGFSGHRASAVAAGLGARQAWLWTARTICTRRGRFRLGPTTLIGGDPFGLFPSHRSVGSVREVVVLPPTVPLPTFPIPGPVERRRGTAAADLPGHPERLGRARVCPRRQPQPYPLEVDGAARASDLQGIRTRSDVRRLDRARRSAPDAFRRAGR